MKLDSQDQKPIYIQLQEGLENAILAGTYAEETQIPSTTELSRVFQINPATAGKGVNALVDEGFCYKKRGIGIFVKEGARKMLMKKRQAAFKEDYLLPLIKEARQLDISSENLIRWIKEAEDADN
ncbi:MAG: GntR family transcriptional regulator [Clostridiaceae bacterium]|jgi:GntR family transcriptional regulator|nr:GntR family transcriptional regulator [Clostridia bacterium]MBP6161377.1 GntR family transcriptional regulator [Clostridia bacterium]MBP6949518.1 GntR family transcriptional regulator [Clostridia bacterium]NMA36303.1 GntR family transcriptional regulator [Clostridiaceae bacterium]NMB28901.1 GntR family transcriptional regulator [Clostridiaceae bacterium]